ncbi:CLUMA_CG009264, isoform A [Clunio marinus]|uniref:CLUMA_CG009264, isoform A n=1 Tax=Clunio marinus TaxID=568069 RepID=A0A1J1I8B8_9DIPT|nr:CLUMA_CG009264, isoform A [Clunio marinus]
MILKSAVLLSLFAVAIAFPALNETLKDEPSGRVIGGNNAFNGQFPFVASIRDTNNNHFCSGVLISNEWVVTLRTCMQGRTTLNTRVAFGSVNRSGGWTYTIWNIFIRPNVDPRVTSNDIALIQTWNFVTLDNLVWPANSPSFRLSGGQTATAMGWGNTAPNGSPANTLQWTTLTVTDTNTCGNFFWNIMNFDWGNSFCTVTSPGASVGRMCTGDDGAPLVIGNTVHGILRFSSCGIGGGFPDLFLSLFDFRDWIRSTTGMCCF